MFSIIIPVYNKGPHVRRSISSVLNQTFQDFDLIVVNDASSDNSLEEMEKFDDPRIRIFQRKQRGPGGYAARNLGIREAKGKWISFLDADDEWFSSHLTNMYELARKFPDCHFLSCGWKIVDPTGRSYNNKYYDENKARGPHRITLLQYLAYCVENKCPTHTDVGCIRNTDIALDLFPDGHASRGGDLHAWISYLAQCKELAWSPTVGAVYHQNSVNMVTKSAPATVNLQKKITKDVETLVSRAEMRMLRKYSNRRIFSAWTIQKQANENTFSLASNLYWNGDWSFCLTQSLWSLLPASVTRTFVKLKQVISG